MVRSIEGMFRSRAIEFCVGLSARSKSVDSKSVMIAIDLVERAVVDSSVLRGCNLERPRTSETSEDTHLLVSGWAVGKDAPVARVDVTTAGTTLESIPVIRERPDIAKASRRRIRRIRRFPICTNSAGWAILSGSRG